MNYLLLVFHGCMYMQITQFTFVHASTWLLHYTLYLDVYKDQMKKSSIQTNHTFITLGFVFPTGFLSLLNVSGALPVLAFSVELEKINIS